MECTDDSIPFEPHFRCFRVKEQTCLKTYTKEYEALESNFPKQGIFGKDSNKINKCLLTKLDKLLSRNLDPNMDKNRYI